MRMGTYHGALLLVLAMVMAMLSTGICIGTAPVPAPAPTAGSSIEYPPVVHKCFKVLSNSSCDPKACTNDCSIKIKGDGMCLQDECFCYYPCKRPPPPA